MSQTTAAKWYDVYNPNDIFCAEYDSQKDAIARAEREGGYVVDHNTKQVIFTTRQAARSSRRSGVATAPSV